MKTWRCVSGCPATSHEEPDGVGDRLRDVSGLRGNTDTVPIDQLPDLESIVAAGYWQLELGLQAGSSVRRSLLCVCFLRYRQVWLQTVAYHYVRATTLPR